MRERRRRVERRKVRMGEEGKRERMVSVEEMRAVRNRVGHKRWRIGFKLVMSLLVNIVSHINNA